MGDDAEKGPQQGADQQPPDGYLLLPRRDCRRRRKEGLRDFGAHGVGRRTSSVAGSRCRRRRRRRDWEERLELLDGRRWRVGGGGSVEEYDYIALGERLMIVSRLISFD